MSVPDEFSLIVPIENSWTGRARNFCRPGGLAILLACLIGAISPVRAETAARPGDIIFCDPADRNDTYRVAALSFECTYEVAGAAESRP